MRERKMASWYHLPIIGRHHPVLQALAVRPQHLIPTTTSILHFTTRVQLAMAKRKQKNNSPQVNGHDSPKQEVNGTSPNQYPHRNSPIFKAWSGSRTSRASTEPLSPGSQRDFSLVNVFHAFQIVRLCLWDMFLLMWRLHPTRTTLLLLFNVIQGLFPAVRGYSRARILDEVYFDHSMTVRVPPLTTRGLTGSTFVRDRKLSIRPFGETAPYGRHPNVCGEASPRFFVSLAVISN
jgi:hypothetical protein